MLSLFLEGPINKMHILPSLADLHFKKLSSKLCEVAMGDLRPTIIAINSVLILLSISAIGCRVGRRIILVGSFGWHDGKGLVQFELHT